MSLFCNVCGRRTYGQHFVYQRMNAKQAKGLVVCLHCEDEAERCATCQIPIHSSVSYDGLCLSCAAQAPVCAACERRIIRQVVHNLSNDVYYCEHCFTHQPHCGVCGGAVGRKGHELHDGRFICAQCHQTAIYDLATAKNLYQRVIGIMSFHLKMPLKLRPALLLVDRNQMLEILKQTSPDDIDQPEQVLGIFVQRNERRDIYIQSGLPQILMIEVMAHEYAHAWQAENCPWQRKMLIIEGFAEWAAYRVLTILGAVKKAALMEWRTDIYGQGLQFMLTLERQGGAAAVFHACQ
ncbi:MAG: hypothetical protein ACPGWR_10270 [Ardenticatenaceae bacterium]